MKIHPSAKIILAFILTFSGSYILIHFITAQINHREQRVHFEASEILQREISEQFQRVLDMTLVIGQMSSAYILSHDKTKTELNDLLKKVLEDREYIIGINQLTTEGKILINNPGNNNQEALGKISQNFPQLLESYKNKDKFWFSPPFELFQGGPGFVFYIPLQSKNKFLGWIAPVISSRLFFEHFRTFEFFNNYDLVIKDLATGNTYFSTGIPPQKNDIQEDEVNLWGRRIIFQSWPKESNAKFSLPLWGIFLICLTVSFFCALLMKIHLQKDKAYNRLKDISKLLNLTSHEVLSSLVELQKEYLKKDSSIFENSSISKSDIQSATNLFEQIELLQNIAESEHYEKETFEILPLIEENIELFSEVIFKKNLKITLDATSFNKVEISANKWLIGNTVLKNALAYSTLVSSPNGKINVSHSIKGREYSTIFHIEKIITDEMSKAFRIERRLLVAQNVMNMLNGRITISEDDSGSMEVRLTSEASSLERKPH